MKIIFLDFDGVLNCTGSFVYGSDQMKAGNPFYANPHANPNPVSVGLIDRLLSEDESIKIVVSSTWRKEYPTVEGLKDVLKNLFGMTHVDRVIGMTGTHVPSGGTYYSRGYEIEAWLMDNADKGITHWVTIDDVEDAFRPEQDVRLCLTSMDYGFQYPEYEQARILLGLRKRRGLFIG